MVRFEELLLICDIREDLSFTINRFKSGLRSHINRCLAPYHLDSIEVTFEMASEVEHYLKQTYRRV